MKGQISLDLLLTIIILIIFVSTTTIIINEIKQNNEIITLNNQLKIQSNDYASIITTTQALEEFSYTIKLKINKIDFKNDKVLPEITFETGKLFIKISEINNKIETKIPTNKNNLKQEEGFLVIKNE
ncbi:MAG: hypothetical protein PHP82_02990 [Candidatus ainarchaeum sp.]|nr:hypothetical protein [Candidatus ainarchaeum sp.]